MTVHSIEIRDTLLETILLHVRDKGWSWEDVTEAAQICGYQDDMASSMFPGGLSDVVAHYADYVDRRMLAGLEDASCSSLRVRDRIRLAVLTRLAVVEHQKEEVRKSLAFWSVPTRALYGQRVLYRTSDRIWNWAGDISTDYNRYTKRGLLSSVLMGTFMVWITDESKEAIVTQAFLDRRLENIVKIGQAIGTMKSVVPPFLCRANIKK
jgi:ubiquinone biosynthesis protein COQ9